MPPQAPTTHPRPEQLAAFSLGRLEEAVSATVADHLSACSTCRNVVENTPPDTLLSLLQAASPRQPATGTPSDLGAAATNTFRSLPGAAGLGGGPAELPEVFGRYRIVKKIGQGGMGAVYQARDTQLDRLVALKVPHFRADATKQVYDRFYREARAAAAFDHPNLCPVYDVGCIDNVHYLTMPFIEGRSLSEFIQPERPQGPRQVASVVRKLALALDEAHKRGVIHRDLKPTNVMINQRKEPVVMDFGLARLESSEQARLTAAGVILGTPAYMSPEQVLGEIEKIGPRADIYSLGVMLYELLTGQLPFQGSTTAVLAQIVTAEPRPPSQLRAGIEPALEAICLKAMAKNHEARYASMAELAAALTAYLKNAGGPTANLTVGIAPAPAAATAVPMATMAAPAYVPDANPFEAIEAPPLVASRAEPPLVRRPTPASARRRPNRRGLLIGVAALGGVLLAGIVFYVATDRGRVKIQVNDPEAQVEIKVDGEVITLAGPDDTVRLRVGEHLLQVTAKGFKTETKKFTVRRGESDLVTVELQKEAPAVAGNNPPVQPPIGNSPPVQPPTGFTPQAPRIETLPPGTIREFKNSIDMKLVCIPAGSFDMGSEQGDGNEKPVHRVTITRPYYLGMYEVTQKEFEAVTGENPAKDQAPNKPAQSLSWEEATAFCKKLSDKEGRTYRLPTEAEWEFACRAGTTTAWSFGDNANEIDEYAWHQGTSNKNPQPVGLKKPNPWGLYDMHGNVWEFCSDWFAPYPSEAVTDPQGPPFGPYRAMRGGSHYFPVWESRSSNRPDRSFPARGGNLGFRVLLELPGGGPTQNPVAPPPPSAQFEPLQHAREAATVAFSHDSKLLASASRDGTVKIWDLGTGKERATLVQGTDRVSPIWMAGETPGITFSPDGQWLASWSDPFPPQSAVRFWNVATAQPVKPLPAGNQAKGPVAFSPDSKVMATGGTDRKVHLWDLAAGKEIGAMGGDDGAIWALAFSADGKMLAAGSISAVLHVWNVADRSSLWMRNVSFAGAAFKAIYGLAFTPDGQTLVAAIEAGMGTFDAATGQPRGPKGRQFTWGVFSLALSPDGKQAAMTGRSGEASHFNIVDVATGKVVQKITDHKGTNNVAWSRDGRLIATAGGDKMVRLWDTTTWKEWVGSSGPVPGAAGLVQTFDQHTKSPRCLAFSVDGRYALSGGDDHSVRLWDLEKRQQDQVFVGHTSGVFRVAFAPDGHRVYSCGEDGTVRIWALQTGKELQCVEDKPAKGKTNFIGLCAEKDLAFGVTAPDGIKGPLVLWDLKERRELNRIDLGWQVWKLVFAPGGGKALYCGGTPDVQIWDVANRRSDGKLVGHTDAVSDVAMSGDSRRALTGSWDGTVRVWDLAAKKLERTLPNQNTKVNAVAISADGRWGLSGADDHSVRFWDLDKGQEISRFTDHTKPVRAVALSPDARSGISAGEDRTVRLWRLPFGQSEPTKEITNAISMKLRYIPAGEFQMGSAGDTQYPYPDENPQHRVRITSPFYMGVYEVTQEEYQRVMGTNPSHFSPSGPGGPRVAALDWRRLPVEQVTWNDAVEFCRKLSDMEEEKKAGRTYRLPTEAEWEYAARAGTTTRYWTGDTLSSREANYNGTYPNPGQPRGPWLGRPHTVGSFDANPFGLYDINGNVWEWCSDGKRTYGKADQADPFGPDSGTRMVRGGGWISSAQELRSAHRRPDNLTPADRHRSTGLRVVMTQTAPAPVSVARLPARPAGAAAQFLGFTLYDEPERVAEVASYTNIALDRGWLANGDRLVKAAREKGLPVVVVFHRNDRPGIEDKLIPFIRQHRDVVAAVGWDTPYSPQDSYTPEDVAALGRRMKQEFPGLQYWVSFTEKPAGKEETRLVPKEVDAILVVNYYDQSPESVQRKVDDAMPGWLKKAEGRPVILRWVARSLAVTQPNPLRLAPGTMKKCGELVRKYNLAGLVLDGYGKRSDGWSTGIDTDATAIQEIKDLARDWGMDASPPVPAVRPPELPPTDRFSLLREFTEHTGQVHAVGLSANGKRAISGSTDKTAFVWNVDTCERIVHLVGHTDTIVGTALSPDGKLALTGGRDDTVRLWEVATGKELQRFEGHTALVYNVAFSPDGKWAASASEDKTALIFDVEKRAEVKRLTGHANRVTSVAFSPTSDTVLTGGWDNTVRLWSVQTGQEIKRFSGHTGWVQAVAFSPDGKRILTGSGGGMRDSTYVGQDDNSVRLWDVATGNQLQLIAAAEWGGIACVAFLPDSRHILFSEWKPFRQDRFLFLWDTQTEKAVAQYQDPADWAPIIRVATDGKVAVIARSFRADRAAQVLRLPSYAK